MRLLILGAPGAGKGTQALRLAARYRIPSISTGDIFRANIAGGTPLGRQAKAYVDRGAYVPDELTNGLVRDRLSLPDAADGFLLDGFPRTLAQVAVLDDLVEAAGALVDAVVQLVVDEEEILRRLADRAQHQGRTDDEASVIRDRLALHRRETRPVVAAYAARGLLVSVDAVGPVDLVTERVGAALDDVVTDRRHRTARSRP